MKKIIALFLTFLPALVLSGCAYGGFNVKSENHKFALAIQRFEFLRHHTVPIVTPPKPAGYGAPAGSLKLGKPGLVIKAVKKSSRAAEKKPAVQARIHGSVAGLPVLSVNFVKTPLWKVLQTLSNETGYVFTSKGVNLAKKVNFNGRYNFAVLLSKIFNGKGENTTVNIKTKRVRIWR